MVRPTLPISVLALLMAAPVLAQSPTAPAAPTELQQSGLTPPTVLSQGYSASGEDVLATQLLGQTIYASVEGDEEIGKITDMVVTAGLGITAVVVSVGGFLGVGDKQVAIDFADMTWAQRQDGSRRWVVETTKEQLTEAPAFIWGDSEEITGEPALTREQEEDQLVDGDPNAAPIDPTLTTDQPERTHISTPIDTSGFSEFDESALSADQLRGIGVYGIGDEQIGTIGDVLTNPDGSFDAVIVDVGGFLGLGAKPVAVAFENLTFSTDIFDNRYLFLNTTREQLEVQPPYDPDTYTSGRNSQRLVITP